LECHILLLIIVQTLQKWTKFLSVISLPKRWKSSKTMSLVWITKRQRFEIKKNTNFFLKQYYYNLYVASVCVFLKLFFFNYYSNYVLEFKFDRWGFGSEKIVSKEKTIITAVWLVYRIILCDVMFT
jgi:hypothetical protein